jgi:hypothetical protein
VGLVLLDVIAGEVVKGYAHHTCASCWILVDRTLLPQIFQNHQASRVHVLRQRLHG